MRNREVKHPLLHLGY